MKILEYLHRIDELLARPSRAPSRLRPFFRPYRALGNELISAVRALLVESAVQREQLDRLEHRLTYLEGEFGKERHAAHSGLQGMRLRAEALQRLVEFEALGDGTDRSPVADKQAELPAGFGVNVVGWVDYDFGVAEGARSAVRILEAAGIPVRVVPFPEELPEHARSAHATAIPDSGSLYDVSIFHLDPRYVDLIPERLGPDFLPGRYNIFYFNWELPRLPDAWRRFFDWCDEVWTPTRFVYDAVVAAVPKPVSLAPHAVAADAPRGANRAEFGLPEGAYIFLCSLDFHSELERKNPMAAIRAFRMAFDVSEQRRILVVKTHNGAKHPEELARLTALCAEHPGIMLMDRHVSRAEMTRLQAVCDAYVSTHRSEGFGLGMVEAMALGKPVLATPWSGSRDFIRKGISFPIPCGRSMLEQAHGPYPAGEWWAEPRVEALAGMMLRLAANPEIGAATGRRAEQWVAAHFSPEAVGRIHRRRLSEIAAALERGDLSKAPRSPNPEGPEQEPTTLAEAGEALKPDEAEIASKPSRGFYAAFEDRFRGSREEIARRLRDAYQEDIRNLLTTFGPDVAAVDLGCGRGEWLELLRAEGFLAALGVDRDQELLQQCRNMGLDVVHRDALDHLLSLPRASVGLVSGFHLLEHLPFDRVLGIFRQTHRVLRPGGLAIFETPNAENLQVGACLFHLDPSHFKPLPGPLLEFTGHHCGFSDVELRHLHPYMQLAPHVLPTGNTDMDRMLFGPLDVAVLLRR
ncbi:methyltransferase domain-containing protein [Desulfonatronum lacustre]|uniref:methyltransferase domain-containing protein n=1 Tax=Desulfonatronum lacustre TaxID=66849 RepID=UPI0004AD8A3B|nr:methyltransferase domain-containing protein [Desulfonatronum lacustre]